MVLAVNPSLISSSIDPVPEKNVQLENKYQLAIDRLPSTMYFLRRATLPGISIETLHRPTVFRDVMYPGTKMTYEQQFTVDFDVDANFNNWFEIFYWMRGIAFPDNFSQYQNLKDNSPKIYDDDGVVSDARLIVQTNTIDTVMEIAFERIFPTNLSQLQFQTTSSEVLTASATFAYSKFDVNR